LFNRWYYHHQGQRCGPVRLKRLRRMLETGRLTPADRVWDPKTEQWIPLIRFEPLRDVRAGSKPDKPAVRIAWPSRRLVMGMLTMGVVGLSLLTISLTIQRMNPTASGPSAAVSDLIEPVAMAEPEPAVASADYDTEVRPLLKKFCYDCHGNDRQKADLNLEAFAGVGDVLKRRTLFKDVADMIHAHEMPPEDKPQPTTAQRLVITDWIESAVTYCDCDGPIDPGRETIQRLNRAEYNNTVRDLVGLDLKPADEFPTDDVGEGFDNMGDVLSISPLLLEKYLAAAESVLGEAIVTQRVTEPKVARYEVERMSIDGGGRPNGSVYVMTSHAKAQTTTDFPADARYRIRIRSWAQQAGDEPARVALFIDDKKVKTFDVTAPRHKDVTYNYEVDLKAGTHSLAVAFVNDYYNPEHPDPDQRDRNLMLDYVEVEGPIGVKPKPLTDSHRRIFVAQPVDGNQRAAAKKIIDHFATRAFRRPAKSEEIDKYLTLYDDAINDKASHVEAVKYALTAVMVSPHFLFRIERDRPTDHPKGSYPLDSYEMASRLSYFLWSSMPDDELLSLAGQGKLQNPRVLSEQVQRMLRDPKAKAMIDNFALQWLQLRRLERHEPDPKLYPEYDEQLAESMIDEARWFFASIVREDRGILELLDADYTFVNDRLAKHYGIDGVEGDKMQRVALNDRRRGGVLTMAAVLTVTSNPTHTNPVLRGKWVLDQILDDPPPPPPPDVPAFEETSPEDTSLTLRQRMQQHSADATCASCHERMDPLGFALENFDGLGRWRDTDNNNPIDASGVLPDGRKFTGPVELKSILQGDRERFAECLAEKMLTYALGRPLEYFDKCAVDDITAALAADDYRMSTLITQIVLSEPFRNRRHANPDEVQP